jgi:hypothetical protein
MKKYECNMKECCNSIKRPELQIMDTEGEEVQVKNIGNIFNKIIAE